MIRRSAGVLPSCLAILSCTDLPERKIEPRGIDASITQVTDRAHDHQLDLLIARGESAYSAGKIDSARAVWRMALSDAGGTSDLAEARVLTWLGLAAYRLGDYAESRSLGEKALALKVNNRLSSELFKSYNALGLLAWNEGRLRDAITLYADASAAARREHDQASLAKASNNIGLVFVELGDFAQAMRSFEEAYRSGVVLADTLIQARSLTNIGMLHIETGDPGSAVVELLRARSLARSAADRTGEQNILGQLGSAYDRMGEPRLALASMDSALTLSREQGLKQEEASNLELMAGLHRDAGRYRQALRLYQQANAINRELGLDVERGTNLRSSAEIRLLLGRRDVALEDTRAALAIHRSTGARAQELRDLLLLADIEASAGGTMAAAREHLQAASRLADSLRTRVARAEVALARATLADRERDFRTVVATLRPARSDIATGGFRSEWAASALMARAYGGLSVLDSAEAEGRRAVASVERVRGKFGSGLLRASFLSDKSAAYSDLVDVLLRRDRRAEAFEVADAARSRAILENSAATIRDAHSGQATLRSLVEGEALLRRIDVLISLLDAMEETPSEERNPETAIRFASMTRELASTRSAYEAMMVRTSERSAAGDAILGIKPVRVRDVQNALNGDEALVEYFVGPDRLVVFMMTKDGVRSVTRAVRREDLERKVKLALDLLGSSRTSRGSSNTVLEALHELLIRPVRDLGIPPSVSRLIIIPHGAVAYVPFAALRDGQTGTYLVEKMSITSLPSAAAFSVLRKAAAPQPSGSPINNPVALAPFPRDLPGSSREASSFRRVMRGSETIVGAAATEARLRAALARSPVVHVATHGVMNPRNPMFSRVELARGSGESDDDGRLEVHELLALRLQSQLVFLSGCETARGVESTRQAAGEDYATLAQAFLYAGSSFVAATLWRIDDKGAAEFAERFYGRLGALGAVDASASAQREMIRDARFASPYYWAAYQISGAGAPGGIRTTAPNIPYHE
jgi:CHAT domain-containing protein/tetratricopeptide (TPR) repeat protein